MEVTKREFGILPNGKKVYRYTIKTDSEMIAEAINYGCALISLKVRDKFGAFRDVVLGYDDLKGYLNNNGHIGVLAGRYANRIGGARFKLME